MDSFYTQMVNDLEDAVHDLYGYRLDQENDHKRATTERAKLLSHIAFIRDFIAGSAYDRKEAS